MIYAVIALWAKYSNLIPVKSETPQKLKTPSTLADDGSPFAVLVAWDAEWNQLNDRPVIFDQS